MTCQMCGVECADGELCSACDFAVSRMRELGLAIVPAGLFGGCEKCGHACVCRALDAAQFAGASIGACQQWSAASGDEGGAPAEERGTGSGESAGALSADDEIEQLKRRLLARCESECPHGHQGQPVPQCRPQTYSQRLGYCGTLRQWSVQQTGGS